MQEKNEKSAPKFAYLQKKQYLCTRNWEIWPNVPINEPYGEADRMNEVNKEMVND